MVGLLVGLHNYNTLEFKSAWEKQERFYQQLIWRAPAMKIGTSIITGEEVMSYMGDYPTSFGINVVYGAKPKEGISPTYWFFALSENFKGSAEAVTSSAQLEASKPPIFFHGNSMDAIYITYEPGMMQCLWVLRAEDAEYKYLPAEMKKAALVSSYGNVQRTVNTDYHLYRQIVDEDKNTWCYYYEKADLARQYGDWNTVLRLWEEAQQHGYRPGNGFEYLPFIEAYIRMGDWENAFRLTKTANKITEAMYFVLCPTWERLAGETPPNAQKDLYLPKAYDLLRCVPQN